MPSPVTPKPAMVSLSPTATRRGAASVAGATISGSGAASLMQRDVGGGAARGVAREIEARMQRDVRHRDRLAGLVDLDRALELAASRNARR